MKIGKAIAALQRSDKFRAWLQPEPGASTEFKVPVVQAAIEHHYTPSQLAKMWAVSTEVIRILFRNEIGVIKIGNRGTKFRRPYVTLRIPASVAEKVHARLSA